MNFCLSQKILKKMCTLLNGHRSLWERCDDQRGFACIEVTENCQVFGDVVPVRTVTDRSIYSIYSVLQELNLGVKISSSTSARRKQALPVCLSLVNHQPSSQPGKGRAFHCCYNLPTLHIKPENGRTPQGSKFRPASSSRGP